MINKTLADFWYVVGAFLGDGYVYFYRYKNKYDSYKVGIVTREEDFAQKFADHASLCVGKKINYSYYAKRNYWYVRTTSRELFDVLKAMRKELSIIENQLPWCQNSRRCKIAFIEGLFDAEGCVKIIKEKVRKTPKICLDICNTNYELLDLARKFIDDSLGIEARYSIQKPNGVTHKKTVYHLRIYKKESIRKFLKVIKTIKLSKRKMPYVRHWLNRK